MRNYFDGPLRADCPVFLKPEVDSHLRGLELARRALAMTTLQQNILYITADSSYLDETRHLHMIKLIGIDGAVPVVCLAGAEREEIEAANAEGRVWSEGMKRGGKRKRPLPCSDYGIKYS